MSRQQSGKNPLYFDEHGVLKEGDAKRAVSPRIAMLKDIQQTLLGGDVATQKNLNAALRLQKEIDDLNGLGRGDNDFAKEYCEPIPTLVVQSSCCLLSFCCSPVGSSFQKNPQLLKHLEDMGGDKMIPAGSMQRVLDESDEVDRDGSTRSAKWYMQEMSAFECFLFLRAVRLESTFQLQRALAYLSLPSELRSVQVVIKTRASFLQEVRKFTKLVATQLSSKFRESRYEETLLAKGDQLLKRFGEDTMLGAESEGYELRMLLRTMSRAGCCGCCWPAARESPDEHAAQPTKGTDSARRASLLDQEI